MFFFIVHTVNIRLYGIIENRHNVNEAVGTVKENINWLTQTVQTQYIEYICPLKFILRNAMYVV